MSPLPPVVSRYLDAYNRRDVAALTACVTDDVAFDNISNAGESMALIGRPDFLKLAHRAAEIFTKRRQIVRRAVIQGDQVALEIDWTGTPTHSLPGMPAGKEVHLRGATFMQLRGGQIASIVDLS